MFDFESIEQAIGVRFDVAAASRAEGTEICLLGLTGGEFPELLLTMSPTAADAVVFLDVMAPDGAVRLTGLGRAAYRMNRPSGRGHGPVIEVGWLSTDSRLLTLRYTLRPGAVSADAAPLAGRLVALARRLTPAGS